MTYNFSFTDFATKIGYISLTFAALAFVSMLLLTTVHP